MGKIVKYCGSCEEGFAEKFGFCPNCGTPLEAFEMNPLAEETPASEVEHPEAFGADEVARTEPVIFELPKQAADTTAFSADKVTADNLDEDILEIDVEGTEEAAAKPETFMPAAAVTNAEAFDDRQYQTSDNGDKVNLVEEEDDYHLTVIDERNGTQRNGLLLGATAFMLILSLSAVVYSLFEKNLDLAAIDTNELGVYVNIDDAPMPTDEPEKPKLDDDEGGGGGGGGRDEQMETNKGRLADQMPEPPLITPSKTIIQRDNPELVQRATTVGNRQFQQTEEPYGNPNSKSTFLSDGQGTGGGQGSGVGTGQGTGRGTGAGSGIGSGFGSGVGDGDGSGRGDGRGRNAGPPEPPEPKPSGPSRGLQITYKPKPRYTDEARQKNIQGTVTVRVTFLASGQIGSVSPVSSLGYGLTEQAIAAAKQIRFEPQLVNGRPQTVVKSVQFSFTIY